MTKYNDKAVEQQHKTLKQNKKLECDMRANGENIKFVATIMAVERFTTMVCVLCAHVFAIAAVFRY